MWVFFGTQLDKDVNRVKDEKACNCGKEDGVSEHGSASFFFKSHTSVQKTVFQNR
jgi:hypothetical protein